MGLLYADAMIRVNGRNVADWETHTITVSRSMCTGENRMVVGGRCVECILTTALLTTAALSSPPPQPPNTAAPLASADSEGPTLYAHRFIFSSVAIAKYWVPFEYQGLRSLHHLLES